MLLGPRKETTGLLSRHPVLQSEWSQPNGGGRSFLHALLDWHGHPVHFFAVHSPPPGIRWFADSIPIGLVNDQLEGTIMSVVEKVDSTDGSKIVAGDLNTSDQTLAYARLTQVLSDSYREAGQGFGFTFPNNLSLNRMHIPGPFVRLDYIFHSGDWMTLQASVNCEQSSDHCYLVAQLAPKP
jgi:endonuclease/exonuclease/phosphatase (EEP) superfamily protein YafD